MPVFHHRFGLCFTLDPVSLGYVEIGNEKTKLEFTIPESNPWKAAVVMLHTKDDLSDAREHHPYLYPIPGKFKCLKIPIPGKFKCLRIENLILVKTISRA